MKVVILYRPDSEFASRVESFVYEYKRQHPADRLEMVNYDSRDGTATASIYDITQQPAILALRDDGSVANIWQGPELPLMSDIASYTFA